MSGSSGVNPVRPGAGGGGRREDEGGIGGRKDDGAPVALLLLASTAEASGLVPSVLRVWVPGDVKVVPVVAVVDECWRVWSGVC